MIIYSSSPHNGFNLKTAGRTTEYAKVAELADAHV